MKYFRLKLFLLILMLSWGLVACSEETRSDEVTPPEAAIASDAQEQTDPFIWLEELESERAVDWIATQNERSRQALVENKRYQILYEEGLSVLNSEDRVPFGRVYDGYLYNFWRGASNTRGIWRRTSVESLASDEPSWETLLDIDALAEAEGENWVYKRSTCLMPEYDRCMIQLSRGGQGASVLREFSVKTKSFVPDGFKIPEANAYIAWGDKDTLYVGTDLEGNPVSAAGLPLTVKKWRRGTQLETSEVVFEAEATDTIAWTQTFFREEGAYILFTRGITFFNRVCEIITPAGKRYKLSLPNETDIFDVLEGQVIALLREDWDYQGESYSQGTVVTLNLETMSAETLYKPSQRDAVNDVRAGLNTIFLTRLENVANKVTAFSRVNGKWRQEDLALPKNGVAFMMSRDPYTDKAALSFENPVSPSTIYTIDEKRNAQAILSGRELFDADGMRVMKREATSKDGTQIPYFVIGRSDLLTSGANAPTHMTAYGGFGFANKPGYMAHDGKLWLERGGIYVLAIIRGGGEFGPSWHQAAVKTKRQNSYDDFYAVAEDLIEWGITSPEKLGISGTSNGGMLMGVALTQRPDLFNAVAMFVPVLDMVRYVEPFGGANWISEYGDPADEVEGAFLRSISPYHNLDADTDYPIALLYSSTKDDLVHPGHSRKMAALMESHGHDYFYYENAEGGHAGAANNKQEAQKKALLYNYFLEHLTDPQKRAPDTP